MGSFVEGTNVMKVTSVITTGHKCNKVTSVITTGHKCYIKADHKCNNNWSQMLYKG